MQLTANDSLESRIKVRRLIRRALITASVVTIGGGIMVPQVAKAALVTADGGSATDTITIDNNVISNPPGGTIGDTDSARAINGGTLSITNSSITNSTGANGGGRLTSSGAGSTVNVDGSTVDTISANTIVSTVGGGHMIIENTTITGTLQDNGYIPPPGQGVQVVNSTGANSELTLNNSTVNVNGFNNGYYNTAISAYGGGTINLNDVTINSTGDKTYGIWAEANDGIIHGTNVNITTDGNLSHGVSAYGPNSQIDLTGGSITTNGTNSAGIQVNSGSEVTLTNMTVSANDPSSYAISIVNGTSDHPGEVTVDNTILNGNIGAEGYGNVNLTNHSTFNGSATGLSSFVIDPTSTWNNPGSSTFVDFTNGTYTFAAPTDPADLSQYHTLTVDNFIANPGSSIGVNVYADGENSLANKLIINDSYTSDPATPYNSTEIKKNFTNGYHALPENGLVVVQGTNPGAFAAGDFYDPDKLGIYTYYGSFSTDPITNDPQFALYSKINGAVAAISALPALGSSVALSTLPNVQDRMHAPRSSVTGTGQGDAQRGIWARLFGGHDKFRSDKSGNVGFDNSLWAVQAGYDLMAKKNADGGRNYAGLYLAYGDSSGDAQVNGNNVGRLDLDATSVGAYWTTYTPSNTYLSVTGQYSWFSSIKASGEGETADPNGSGFALSLEGGKTLHDDKSVVIEPQAQLIYQHTKFDNVTLPAGGDRPADTPLSISNMNAVTGRLGVLFRKNRKSGENFLPWAKVNLWHTFSGSSKLDAPLSDQLDSSMKGTSLEARIGFNFLGNDNSNFSVSADGGYLFDIGGAKNSGWRGSIGAAYKW